jgi:hypothetical protein
MNESQKYIRIEGVRKRVRERERVHYGGRGMEAKSRETLQ